MGRGLVDQPGLLDKLGEVIDELVDLDVDSLDDDTATTSSSPSPPTTPAWRQRGAS